LPSYQDQQNTKNPPAGSPAHNTQKSRLAKGKRKGRRESKNLWMQGISNAVRVVRSAAQPALLNFASVSFDGFILV
jgi:hypothetical protein